MNANGLQSFALHREKTPQLAESIRPPIGVNGLPTPEGAPAMSGLDPESAARRYLDEALARENVPDFTRPEANRRLCDFQTLGADTIPLTETRTVKFRQVFQHVPVYGSLVTVEMDEDNELISLNSSMGTPEGVSPVARIAPEHAVGVARTSAGYGDTTLEVVPRLYYYFQQESQQWRLVYVLANVLKKPQATKTAKPELVDYVVDAHSGDLVAELPRTATLKPPPFSEPLRPLGPWRRNPEITEALTEEAADDLGRKRSFACKVAGGVRQLIDEALNVHTFDFTFRDLAQQANELPGEYVVRPPEPWASEGVSAQRYHDTLRGL